MLNVELAENFLKEGLDGDCFCRNSKAVAIKRFAKWLDERAAQQSVHRTALPCGHAIDLLDKIDNKCLACGKPAAR